MSIFIVIMYISGALLVGTAVPQGCSATVLNGLEGGAIIAPREAR
ncbi:MAG: hypothetical protein ACFBZ9_03235 [Sphingomonadales bacterium]